MQVSNWLTTAVVSCVFAMQASAGVVGFNESFTANSASWRNSNGAADLAWFSSGGPSGGSYASSTFNLISTTAGGFPPTVIRAQPVQANVWTTIFINLTATSPNFVSFEGSSYAAVFSNIGNMQFGFTVPAALVGQNIDGHFDIADFNIVPAPGALALIGLVGLARRRAR